MLRPTWRTAPVPAQRVQRWGLVPGWHPDPWQDEQVVRLRIVTGFVAPFTTSSRVTSSSRARSLLRRFSPRRVYERKGSPPKKGAKRAKGSEPPTGSCEVADGWEWGRGAGAAGAAEA